MKQIKEVKQALQIAGITYLENQSLKYYTTLHIGGFANIVVEPETSIQIQTSIQIAKQYQIPYYILGNGSNVLFPDEGYQGLLIVLGRKFKNIKQDHHKIIVSSGTSLKELSSWCLNHHLSGLEFACGIPGSVGGAVVMNAGAYGGEIKDVITQVWYLNQEGNIICKGKEELDFSYRHSCFSHQEGIVLEVEFFLQPGNYEEMKDIMEDLMEKRRSKQPLDAYSAGSTFKRPEGNYASVLIAESGLQGYSINDASVSNKHAGFLINQGNATANDFLKLINHVKKQVYETSGIHLECEVIQVDEKASFGSKTK